MSTYRTDLETVESEMASCLAAGDHLGAVWKYVEEAGGVRNIAWSCGDYVRGARLIDMLTAGKLPQVDHSLLQLWYEGALYDLALGKLVTAEARLRELLDIVLSGTLREPEVEEYRASPLRFRPGMERMIYAPSVAQSLAEVLIAQGRLHGAEQAIEPYCTEAQSQLRLSPYSTVGTGLSTYGMRGLARGLRGSLNLALDDFTKADDIQTLYVLLEERYFPHGGVHAAWHAILLAWTGRLRLARYILQRCEPGSRRDTLSLLEAHYDLANAEIALASAAPREAIASATAAQQWADGTGHRATQIRSRIALGRALNLLRQPAEAETPLREAEQLARESGYRMFLADALAAAGRTALQLARHDEAASRAVEAIGLSSASECDYPWGEAAASHLWAEAALRLGDRTTALFHARRARDIRKSIGDARLANSIALLSRATAAI